MGETDLGLFDLFSNFKNDLCALPFALILRKIKVVIQNKPNHFFAGDKLRYFYFGAMDVFVMIIPFLAEFIGAAFNFLRPPSANIINGSECFSRSLIDRKARSVILI